MKFWFFRRLPLAYLVIVPIVILSVFFAGCSLPGGASQTATPAATASSATPFPLPASSYAFVRFNNLWIRKGTALETQFTQYNLANGAAKWGNPVWSPDLIHIAYTLQTPRLAPGNTNGYSYQQTGTLFIGNTQTFGIHEYNTAGQSIVIPLQGRHIAWVNNTTMLYTENGNIFEISPETDTGSVLMVGPTNVWEIATDGINVYYSTIAHIGVNGVGIAELRKFSLSNPLQTSLVALLGPASLAPLPCGSLLCPFDEYTFYSPYAWSLSADGTAIAYQSGYAPGTTIQQVLQNKHTVALADTVIYLQNTSSKQALKIFANAQIPNVPLNLAISPTDTSVALALADNSESFAPYIQPLATNSFPSAYSLTLPNQLQVSYALFGPIAWSPDGSVVTFQDAQVNQQNIVGFTAQQTSTIIAYNAKYFAWGP